MPLTELRLDFQSDFLSKGLAVGILVRPYAVGVVAGDSVYQRPDGLIDKASASSSVTMPALGIAEVIDSPGPGDAVVRYDGDTSVVPGLTTGKVYVVGTTPGSIVAEDDTINPAHPGSPGDFQQQIGLASGPAVLFVRMSLFKLEIN